MSDYEVTLVNDCMQEFYVRFHGPTESVSDRPLMSHLADTASTQSPLRRWSVEDTC